LGKILGINIYLHYSWFLIFAFFTYILYQFLLENHPLWMRLTAGMGASLLLFASVLSHELAHSLVAIRNGIPVKNITLFFLGGVARITREAPSPMIELRMAIAGPLCSLMLAGIFGLIWYLIWGITQQNIAYDNPILWLAEVNFILALFNLVPGFPLDGGRVLRALIWRFTGNYKRASRVASLTGRGFAYLLIGGGIVWIFSSIFAEISPVQGIWFIFIGWFLSNAAGASYRQVEAQDVLQGFTAQAVMNTNFVVISPDLSLRELVQGYILSGSQHYFVVAHEGSLKGTVTLEDIKKVPQTQWNTTPVSAAMLPTDKGVSAHPGDAAANILEKMEEQGINQIPVIRDGMIVGIVVRENLLRFIRLRSELKV
jgi:Zn-dependent protease/predicted transcriptional regulator